MPIGQPLTKGQEFLAFEILASAFEDWQAPYTLDPVKTDAKAGRFTRKCAYRPRGCPFYFHASYQKRVHCLVVSNVVPEHTCAGITVAPPGRKQWSIASQSSYVAPNVGGFVSSLSATGTKPGSMWE